MADAGARAQIRTREVDDLLHVLAAMEKPDGIFDLLEDMFTIREIRETSQRLAVARLLDAGLSYSAIEKETGASATTIARVSKCLTYGTGGYRKALDVLAEGQGD
ncbi:YerC/YecD family TrpR-related protein [Adlercreutzia murintestinalis]|uniref:YerC/YecD family TrpR-related protein n=1 Tax=Adlercreutzia murintestinalis TaxID=2941325 RepID=UPI00203BDB12|nr:YerC/YecD family TrpR-related protein [Adlercreutzia murintestinalis]